MKRDMKNECYTCIHKRPVPGDEHIRCVNPDPAMVGVVHGVRRGWFIYPMLFDPIWKARPCQHYQTVTDDVLPKESEPYYDETRADEERDERRAWRAARGGNDE